MLRYAEHEGIFYNIISYDSNDAIDDARLKLRVDYDDITILMMARRACHYHSNARPMPL